MDEGNVTVLVDAKEEYTKQLISILKNCIYQGIKSIYMDAKDICNQDNTPDNVLMIFQDLLSRIPKWSQDIINKEFERISNASKCDYIDDLLKVVYVSHIKILTIVHSAQRNKKISIKVPSGSHFIHLCYIECAREFWKDPYYFSDRVSKYEHQKNMRDSESMIAECIMETIRKQLPVRHILKEFLNEPDEEIDEEDDDIKEPAKKKYLKKLESVVKKELKTTSKNGELGDINIELIRQVIREEMSSRPNTDKIKKELVDTVVEKIVEKTQEGFTDKEETEETKETKETKETISNDESTPKEELKPKDETTPKEDNKDIKKNIKNVDFILDKSIDKNIDKNIDKKINKNNSTSLENLLDENTNQNEDNEDNDNEDNEDNDNEDNEDNEIDVNIDNLITSTINDDLSNIKNIKSKSKTNTIIAESLIKEEKLNNADTFSPIIKQSKLVINNIDEINLNLDELDNDLDNDLDITVANDLENEIDLDEMQSVDFNQKTIKDDKIDSNTKYIFFKDVE